MITEAQEKDQAKRLALLLQAIADLHEERAEAMAEFKARLETLEKESSRLRFEILTGQQSLPMEVA